jgi:hypothetical protein
MGLQRGKTEALGNLGLGQAAGIVQPCRTRCHAGFLVTQAAAAEDSHPVPPLRLRHIFADIFISAGNLFHEIIFIV